MVQQQSIGEASKTSIESSRILIVLPLLMYNSNGRLYIDTQACNGLRLWLKNFEYVTLACPVIIVEQAPKDTLLAETIEGIERLTFVTLPVAYKPVRFLVKLPKVIRTLNEHIALADYLHFAIGGVWGDWGSIASLLAARSGLQFAIWTDKVESQVIEFSSRSKTGFRRLYAYTTARIMAYYEKYLIRRCALGLFHGMDCFQAYSPYCSNPHIVHNIHVSTETLIASTALVERLMQSASGPLRLVYAGRVHREKGVYDWIEALSLSSKRGVDFSATWFGEGPELDAARDRVKVLGLASKIEFPGAVDSHAVLMSRLKRFDAFVFCHKLLESPRCLIEALVCGLPIVGYETDYSRELIRAHGGGLLTPKDDIRELSNSIVMLSKHRKLLSELSECARWDGAPMTDENVFRHRSELMKLLGSKMIFNACRHE